MISFSLALILSLFSVQIAEADVCQGKVGGLETECAPDFQLRNLDGKNFQLSKYRGKVVLLNFWATWCPPCVDEIPSMQKLRESLDGEKIVILAASIDSEGKSEIDRFFQSKLPGQRHTFDILLDSEQKVSKSYGTFKVPETYIIDKTGRIRDKIIGAETWDKGMIVHYLELLANE